MNRTKDRPQDTPQAAVTASRPPFAITHAPGQMFITDARDEQYRVA